MFVSATGGVDSVAPSGKGRHRKRNYFFVAGGALALGILLTSAVLLPIAAGSGSNNEGLRVEGYGVFKVYNPQGALVSQWSGQNTLANAGVNAIAGCLSGNTTTPSYTGSCAGLTDGMVINWDCGTGSNCGGYAATSTSTQAQDCFGSGGSSGVGTCFAIVYSGKPSNDVFKGTSFCDPATGTSCTGWNVTITTAPGTFTPTTCASPGNTCTINRVVGAEVHFLGGLVVPPGREFDTLSPSIAVGPGDTLVLTIGFVVS